MMENNANHSSTVLPNTPAGMQAASGSNTQRGRSQTESAVSLASGIGETTTAGPDLPYRNRLYQLFAAIDKEFEALYLENYQLKLRLGQNPELPLGETFKFNDNSSLIFNELNQKLSGKKTYLQQRQKWKSALRGPPGRLVTSLKSGTSVDSSKSRRVRSFGGHLDAVFHLAACSFYGPNGRTVFGTASADQTARIFCPSSGDCFLHYQGHNGAVNSIALRAESSTNDQFVALTASGDRTVHLWRGSLADSNSGMPNSSEDDLDATSEKINDVDDENFTRIPLNLRQPSQTFSGHSDAVVGAEFLAGGEQIISVSWDKTGHIYDVEKDIVLNVLTGHEAELTFCSSHRTSKIVATSSQDCTFRLWDLREAIQSVAVFQGHNASVNSVVFASHHIISSSEDRTVKVWDLRNMRTPKSSARFESGVNRVGTSAKHDLVVVPLDNRHTYIIDLNGNRVGRLHRSNGHSSLVSAAIWLDEVESSMNILTAGIDKAVFGWWFGSPPKN
ncbi:WD repeat-containing protein 37 [Aphelenchoides fujianensis]|nr:WD repeat-containing protein 37 [Aphelenchoides fujianensis]